jgi:hypothetical protein
MITHNLEDRQRSMRERNRNRTRRGRKPTAAIMRARQRMAAFMMRQRGLSLETVAEAISASFSVVCSVSMLREWESKGCPLM